MRRDLRLYDHAALHEALQNKASVQPVFVFDTEILARFRNPQDRRLTFLAARLLHLHEKLKETGGGMLVLHGRSQEIIPKLSAALNAEQVVCEADYEPDTIKRDDTVDQALRGQGRLVRVLDHVILPPNKVLKDDGDPYKVFTPYSRKWREHLGKHSFDEKPVSLSSRLPNYPNLCKQVDEAAISRVPMDSLTQMLDAIGYKKADLAGWGVNDEQDRLKHFVRDHMTEYKERRDILADESGTSRLSPYLRFGFISIRHCARLASEASDKGADAWLNELIWREFYQQIMYHFPESVSQEFQEQCRGLSWQKNAKWLDRWREGKTGFPIIDAAMRQLSEIGWMHNRARMIVASFLTKDLLLDWRLGEEHFAQHLMDYELASNVGGWQWAASTGTDAQPYFRIFNPRRQSERFDPDGKYIRRYVPELAELDGKTIHAPHDKKDLFASIDYPEPIVEHKEQKVKAIAMFKQKAAS